MGPVKNNSDSTTLSTALSDDSRRTFHLNLFIDIVNWLSVYYSAFLIVSGCICNTLSFLVFSRPKFKSSSTSIYLRFLCVMDLGAILSGYTRFFVKKAFDINLRSDIISCKISLFFAGFFLNGSSWTLVVVTTERMISIVWPHRVYLMCSTRNVAITLLFLVLAIIISNVPTILKFDEIRITDTTTNTTIVRTCLINTDPLTLTILATVPVIQLTFLPCFLIIILNIVIIAGVLKSRYRVLKASSMHTGKGKSRGIETSPQGHKDGTATSADIRTTLDAPNVAKGSSVIHVHPEKRKNKESGTKISGGSRKETSLTITLLTVTISYIICTFPNGAYGQNLLYRGRKIHPAEAALLDLLDILLYTNNALNFVLYCITGSRFRTEVKAVLKQMVFCRW